MSREDQSSSPSSSELLLDEFDEEFDELLPDEFEELFDEELLELFEFEFDDEFELELFEEFELLFEFEFEFELLFELELDPPSWAQRHLRSDLRVLNCTSVIASSDAATSAVDSLSGANPACAPKGKSARRVAGRISLRDFIGLSIQFGKITALHQNNGSSREVFPIE